MRFKYRKEKYSNLASQYSIETVIRKECKHLESAELLYFVRLVDR